MFFSYPSGASVAKHKESVALMFSFHFNCWWVYAPISLVVPVSSRFLPLILMWTRAFTSESAKKSGVVTTSISFCNARFLSKEFSN